MERIKYKGQVYQRVDAVKTSQDFIHEADKVLMHLKEAAKIADRVNSEIQISVGLPYTQILSVIKEVEATKAKLSKSYTKGFRRR